MRSPAVPVPRLLVFASRGASAAPREPPRCRSAADSSQRRPSTAPCRSGRPGASPGREEPPARPRAAPSGRACCGSPKASVTFRSASDSMIACRPCASRPFCSSSTESVLTVTHLESRACRTRAEAVSQSPQLGDTVRSPMGPEELDQDQVPMKARGVEALAELVDGLEMRDRVAHLDGACGNLLATDRHRERQEDADQYRE